MFGLSNDPQLHARLSRLERKMDQILEHLGIEETSNVSDRVRRLAEEGRKIEAIKAYREETGVG